MRVFDEIQRSGIEPAAYGESHFAYMNRTARPDFTRVRAVLEEWFSRYPPAHQPDLRGRLRSFDDKDFDGAFFELYLHELLVRLGHEVKVHPLPPSDGKGRPDFLARRGRSEGFYLEAKVAREPASNAAAQLRISQAYEALNRIESPDFFLFLEDHGSPATPVPSRLRAEVGRFLKRQDYELCLHLFREGGFAALPTGVFEHDGWRLAYAPIPKRQSARGERGLRPIAMTGPAEVSRLDNVSGLRRAVRKKAGRYGLPDRPLIIAVNVLGKRLSHYWNVEALFGSQYGTYRNGVETVARLPDGAWFGPGGPQLQRVSAVLVTSSLLPWSVAVQPVSLYHNPWAYRPSGSELAELPSSRPTTNVARIEQAEGISPVAVFGLPENWPAD